MSGYGGGAGGSGARGGQGLVRVCAHVMHSRNLGKHLPSHSYNAGKEHVGFVLALCWFCVGFSPTRQTLGEQSAKRRDVFGESHKGWGKGGKIAAGKAGEQYTTTAIT